MMMDLVIPGKEVLAKGPGIFDTAKLCGKRGLIFQGFELRLRKRIVIGHLGTLWLLVTPRSESRNATVFEVIDVPRSAWSVNCPGSMACF